MCRVLSRPLLAALCVLALLAPARAGERFVTTSDGVRLHLIEAGSRTAPTILFVPGWTMPAWIWQLQLQAFAPAFHVIAMDPRGQGASDAPPDGYDYRRRGQDIAEVVAAIRPHPVLLVAWSLGVLDSLAYVHEDGDQALSGLVLVDNSVGEEPAPIPGRNPIRRGPPSSRAATMRRFVASMFRHDPGERYIEALTDAALRTPPSAAAALLNYGAPRSYWRDALYSTRKPVLYIVRPRFAAQAANVAAQDPAIETMVFPTAGHALFIDDAPRFDAALASFIRRRIAG